MNENSVVISEKMDITGGTIERLVNSFIDSLDVKDISKLAYKKGVAVFTLWLVNEGVKSPRREDVIKYKGYLQGEGLSSFTVSSYLVAVRRFFGYLESLGLYPNITQGVKSPKRARGFRKDSLTVDQVREVLNSIDRSTIEGKRDYALLNLLVRTGLRTIEVVRANIEDLRQQSGEAVLWVHGKGRDLKDEFVLLTKEALIPLYEYLAVRDKTGDAEPLFTSLSDRNRNGRLTTTSISRIVKTGLRGINLDSARLTAHSLRHTFATLALVNGAALMQVKEAMRHNSIETTMVYAHSLDRIRNGAERYVNI